MMKKLGRKLTTVALLSLPLLTLAQGPVGQIQTGSNVRVDELEDITRIIVGLVNWITGLFFVAAILSLFYAAYLYLAAGGDPEKLGSAKNTLIYSIIAIAIALLASSVRFIVENILTR